MYLYRKLLSEEICKPRKQKHIRKPCLFNTLQGIKSLQPAGLREKFNSLHFPETENGRGFDSRLNTRRCVLQLMS